MLPERLSAGRCPGGVPGLCPVTPEGGHGAGPGLFLFLISAAWLDGQLVRKWRCAARRGCADAGLPGGLHPAGRGASGRLREAEVALSCPPGWALAHGCLGAKPPPEVWSLPGGGHWSSLESVDLGCSDAHDNKINKALNSSNCLTSSCVPRCKFRSSPRVKWLSVTARTASTKQHSKWGLSVVRAHSLLTDVSSSLQQVECRHWHNVQN